MEDIALSIGYCLMSLLTRMQDHLLLRLLLKAHNLPIPRCSSWQCAEALCLVMVLLSILQEVSLSQDSQALSMLAGRSKTASWRSIFIVITG